MNEKENDVIEKNKILSRNFNNSMVASGLSEEHIAKNWLAEDGDVNSEKTKKDIDRAIQVAKKIRENKSNDYGILEFDNVKQLRTEVNDFLTKLAPEILSTIEDSNGENPVVSVSDMNNIFGANYTLKTSSVEMKMWVGVNVDRVFVIYFVKDSSAKRSEEVYKFTFGGAESIGYNIHYEPVIHPKTKENITSIWCTWPKIQNSQDLGTGLLSNPSKKLFIIQDIAMMTQSFIRASERSHIDICSIANPEPM